MRRARHVSGDGGRSDGVYSVTNNTMRRVYGECIQRASTAFYTDNMNLDLREEEPNHEALQHTLAIYLDSCMHSFGWKASGCDFQSPDNDIRHQAWHLIKQLRYLTIP